VAAGDVAQLVRDHALHFADVVGRADQPAVDIDRLPARDEGVDRAVVEQHDIDVARFEAGGLDQRRGDVAEQRLGFGIAQHRLRRRRLHRERKRGETGSDSPRQRGGARRYRAKGSHAHRHHPAYCAAA
jgi:hypothetical protein